jgi:puromycin-sensitive aminopeptidase
VHASSDADADSASSPDATYRLPRTVEPTRYELRIEPDLTAARYTGTVDIAVEVREAVNEVVLNARELVVGGAWLTGPGGARVEATAEVDDDTERLHLRLAGTAQPGSWSVHIEFAGIVNDKLKGFYRSVFTDDHGVERVIGTTQMEPTDARQAFPCWDEPDRKAVFAVTLVVDEELLAISNAAELDRTPAGDGRVAVRFADTIPMSTYLVAWVVGPLEATEPIDVDGVPLRVVHVPGKAHLTPFALDVGAFSLRLFSGYYGIPYPADKCDLVALPDFAAGAMENLGCITFREAVLLVDPEEATNGELSRVADVVAHELAHMWFGDLVTMRWWNGLWLNEAFATFMELAAVDAYRPEWLRWVAFTNERAAAFAIDSLEATRPIEFPVHSPQEAEGMFDLLTYQKGASVLRMLEQYLGEDRFRAGIRLYLHAHELGNAETTDLWDAIEEAAGDPVRRIMDTWIFQGGYPVISVQSVPKEGGGDEVTLRQERFRFDDGDRSARWSVPLLLDAGAGLQKVLLDGDSTTITVPGADHGVVVNAGGHGFYRVRYAPDMLARLRGRLGSLAPIERAILVDDAWASVLAGETTALDFLDLAAAYVDEDDPAVWTTLVGALTAVDRVLDGTARAGFQTWVRELTGPAIARLGWAPADGEDSLLGQTRQLVLSAAGRLGDDPEVQRRARQIVDDDAGVDPNVVAAAVGIVAAVGDGTDWERYVQRYRDADSPQESLRYQYALGEFPSESLAERTRELCLSELRSQNAPFVVLYLLANRTTGPGTWAWVEEHWTEINERYPGNMIPRFLGGVTALSTPDLAERVAAFLGRHPVPQGGKSVDQHLERLRVNVAFRAREADRLAAHFS